MDYQQFFAVAFRQFTINALAAQKLTPTALANATGLSKSYVAKLCSNKNEPPQPSMANAHLICVALGFDLAKVIYAITQQMPTPERDIRMRKAEKPRVVAKRMEPHPSKTVDVPEAPAEQCTEDEAFDLIDSVEKD